MKKWICIILCIVMLFSISGCTLIRNLVDDPDKEEQEEEEEESEDTEKTKKTVKTTIETSEETTKASASETGEPNQEIQALMGIAAEEFSKVESYSGTMDVGLDADLTMDATGAQSMIVEMSLDYEFYQPTQYVYANYQMKIVQGTMEIEMPFEYYMIDDGGMKMYILYEGTWMDQSSEASAYYDMIGSGTNDALFDVISAGSYGLEMTDGTDQFDGEDVYTITGELTGDALKMLFENSSAVSSSGTTVDISKLDFDSYHVPIVMMVYKDSNLLAFLSYDMIDMLEDVLTQSLAATGYSDIDVVAKEYQASISFTDYDTINNPSIPDEVLEAIS